MTKKQISKERRELEEDLLFHLRNYKLLKAIHHETIDKQIAYLVELLKEKE